LQKSSTNYTKATTGTNRQQWQTNINSLKDTILKEEQSSMRKEDQPTKLLSFIAENPSKYYKFLRFGLI